MSLGGTRPRGRSQTIGLCLLEPEAAAGTGWRGNAAERGQTEIPPAAPQGTLTGCLQQGQRAALQMPATLPLSGSAHWLWHATRGMQTTILPMHQLGRIATASDRSCQGQHHVAPPLAGNCAGPNSGIQRWHRSVICFGPCRRRSRLYSLQSLRTKRMELSEMSERLERSAHKGRWGAKLCASTLGASCWGPPRKGSSIWCMENATSAGHPAARQPTLADLVGDWRMQASVSRP